jgi:hypothetical protein
MLEQGKERKKEKEKENPHVHKTGEKIKHSYPHA